MTVGIGGSTVRLAEGVNLKKTLAYAHTRIQVGVELTVGTSGGAAVGVVTELVNVEATLSVGVVASDVPGDAGRGVLVSLLEGDGASNLGVSADNSN